MIELLAGLALIAAVLVILAIIALPVFVIGGLIVIRLAMGGS